MSAPSTRPRNDAESGTTNSASFSVGDYPASEDCPGQSAVSIGIDIDATSTDIIASDGAANEAIQQYGRTEEYGRVSLRKKDGLRSGLCVEMGTTS